MLSIPPSKEKLIPAQPLFMWQKECNDRFLMESRISLTLCTESTSGTQRDHPSVLAPTTPPQSSSSSMTTFSPHLSHGFKNGEQPSSPALANQERPRPNAEEILAGPEPKTRTLVLTSEEVYQWRQVLGRWRVNVQHAIK